MEYVKQQALEAQAKSAEVYNVLSKGNADALRVALTVLFTPKFKPTFNDPKPLGRGTTGLPNDQLPQQISVPIRMFDIETGHLVERPEIGELDQYCMLSHSWKGNEVTYSYISRARQLDIDEAKLRSLAGPSANLEDAEQALRTNDVAMIKAQCEKDVKDQEETIKALVRPVISQLEIKDPSDIVGDLLERRISTKDAEYALSRAKRQYKDAVKMAEAAEQVEKNIYKLVQNIVPNEDSQLGKNVNLHGDKTKTVLEPSVLDKDVPTRSAKSKTLKEKVEEANENLQKVIKQRAELEADIKIFQSHSRIREAIDAMEGYLQQWKSSIKIAESVRQAKEVFDKKLFQRGGKRYVWLDTCCINKANSGELVESLSLMGDWYENADCCLVHLDTRRSGTEWIETWRHFVGGTGHTPPKPNVTSFEGIQASEPEWATRGWTLQEVILSKTTFYVNSSWTRLGRPIESIGPYYYFGPFIDIYLKRNAENPYNTRENLRRLTKLSTLTRILKETQTEFPYGDSANFIESANVESFNTEPKSDHIDEEYVVIDHENDARESPNEDLAERKSVRVAQSLIVILESLKVQIPKDIDIETSKARITEAVRVATDLHQKGPANETLNALKAELVQPNTPADTTDLINLVLLCLVKVTKDLILKDRKYIAEFNKVQELNKWLDGTGRSKFSAQQVMALACERQCTVETDQAYSLMGILGVRFPTFHAEGLTKALSRLLDEVIITSNDISVFNWSGKEFGSPLRGRSLYPSKLQAYKVQGDEERQREKLKELTEPFKIRRHEMSDTFVHVTKMLQDSIKFVKNNNKKNIRVEWIQDILSVVKEAEFDILRIHLENISKILMYVQKEATSVSDKTTQQINETAPKSDESEKPANSTSSFGIQTPSFSLPQLPHNPFAKSKDQPSDPSEVSSKQSGSKSSFGGLKSPIGKGIGKKDFGFPKGFGKQEQTAPTPITAKEIEPEPLEQHKPSIKSHIANEKDVPIPEGVSKTLDAQVRQYIHSIPVRKQAAKTMTKLALQSVSEQSFSPVLTNATVFASMPTAASFNLLSQSGAPGADAAPISATPVSPPPSAAQLAPPTPAELPTELQAMLSNIENPEFIRHEDKATTGTTISPNPIIINNSGIQGIFDIQRVIITMLDVDTLRRQIRDAASPQQIISGLCTISTGFALIMVSFSCQARMLEKQLDVSSSVESKVLREQHEDGVERNRLHRRATDRSQSDSENQQGISGNGNGSGDNEEDKYDESEESKKVARMITFVQEQDLNLVAGEWVLARFSGVQSAKWFLCSLELGPSRDYYGYRIPTDEIDFFNASPELGLMTEWEKYMERKKRKLCNVLEAFLDAKGSDGLTNDLSNLFTGGTNKDGKNNTNKASTEKGGEAGNGDDDGEDSEDEYSALTQGKEVLAKIGGALIYKLLELRATELERRLSTTVLKKLMPHMRAAVEHLNDNKGMLPSMYHSGKKVHMF